MRTCAHISWGGPKGWIRKYGLVIPVQHAAAIPPHARTHASHANEIAKLHFPLPLSALTQTNTQKHEQMYGKDTQLQLTSSKSSGAPRTKPLKAQPSETTTGHHPAAHVSQSHSSILLVVEVCHPRLPRGTCVLD